MYSYKLSRTRDVDFFSAPRYDTISTAVFKDGDEICVCNKCGALYLQPSWEANEKKCLICGCTSRKNIDASYLQRFKVQTNKVEREATRRTASRRRDMVPLRTENRPFRVTLPPEALEIPTLPRQNSARRYYNASIDWRPSRTIRPQPYPQRKRKRQKTGRILLGIVIALLVVAITIGILLGLFHSGQLDLSGRFAAVAPFLHTVVEPFRPFAMLLPHIGARTLSCFT